MENGWKYSLLEWMEAKEREDQDCDFVSDSVLIWGKYEPLIWRPIGQLVVNREDWVLK